MTDPRPDMGEWAKDEGTTSSPGIGRLDADPGPPVLFCARCGNICPDPDDSSPLLGVAVAALLAGGFGLIAGWLIWGGC